MKPEDRDTNYRSFSKNLVPVSEVKPVFHVTTPNECRHCNYPRIINGSNEAHNDLDKNIYQLENSEQQFNNLWIIIGS